MNHKTETRQRNLENLRPLRADLNIKKSTKI